MTSTSLKVAIPALCAWRECRSGGLVGMQSVINVLQNRATKYKTDLYIETTKAKQFTSISPPNNMTAANSEANVWPTEEDTLYPSAEVMINEAINGNLPDITGGAVLYYAQTMNTPPDWDFNELVHTATIAGQLFFKYK